MPLTTKNEQKNVWDHQPRLQALVSSISTLMASCSVMSSSRWMTATRLQFYLVVGHKILVQLHFVQIFSYFHSCNLIFKDIWISCVWAAQLKFTYDTLDCGAVQQLPLHVWVHHNPHVNQQPKSKSSSRKNRIHSLKVYFTISKQFFLPLYLRSTRSNQIQRLLPTRCNVWVSAVGLTRLARSWRHKA